MAVSTRDQEVLDALRVVRDPDLHRDIVSLGFVQNLQIDARGAPGSKKVECTSGKAAPAAGRGRATKFPFGAKAMGPSCAAL